MIRRAQQALNLVWNDEVSKTITSPQFAVLNALFQEPNIDQRTLGDRVALDRSTVAEIVARLTSRKLVCWNRNVHDSRRKTKSTRKPWFAAGDLLPVTKVSPSGNCICVGHDTGYWWADRFAPAPH